MSLNLNVSTYTRIITMKQKQTKESEIFGTFLKTKGLSVTRQRKLVLDQVYRDHAHFEAEEIVDALEKRDLRVSRATVYRTLMHLEK